MHDIQLFLDPEIRAALTELYRRKEQLQHIRAQKEQEEMAGLLGSDRKSIEGVGQPTMQIHAEAYHYYGQKYGYDFWKDKGSRAWFLRQAPECKVKAGGTKVQKGYTGIVRASGGLSAGAKRFHKVYPAVQTPAHP